jgi:hypothetical protein
VDENMAALLLEKNINFEQCSSTIHDCVLMSVRICMGMCMNVCMHNRHLWWILRMYVVYVLAFCVCLMYLPF